MATLVKSAEAVFSTTFGLLNVVQSNSNYASVRTFAASFPGGISVACGTYDARVNVRLERWDAAPPRDNDWEDIDELPFESLPGGGPLYAEGADGPTSRDGIDVDGLSSARVRVLARGRYDSAPDLDSATEEWVFQLFPEAGPHCPLAGGPRRLAGPNQWMVQGNDGWDAALHAWGQGGWDALLSSSEGYAGVRRALWQLHRPASPIELAQAFIPSRMINPNELVADPRDALKTAFVLPNRGTDYLAELTGITQHSIGDAIAALCQLQLLLPMQSSDETLLVPNPAPGFVWDLADLREEHVRSLQASIAKVEFRVIADDIAHAVAWADASGLQTSVREMATRWSTSVREIRGGVALLQLLNRVELSSLDTDLGDHAEVVLKTATRSQRA